jgi:hypothetical protein
MLAQQAGKCIVEKDCSPVFPEKNKKNSTKKNFREIVGRGIRYSEQISLNNGHLQNSP